MCNFRGVRKIILTAVILYIVVGMGNATSASAAFNPIRIHAGGAAYTDSVGQVWSADTDFSGGNTYSTSNSIANTNDPALYQTERWGSFSYNFAAPAGTYAVTLKFAEIYFTSAGRRVFGVSINGTSVLSNFDIAAQAGGADIALDKTFQVNSTGNIQIEFITGSADNPKVDAIQILAVSSFGSIRVHSGGGAYTDSAGQVWSADTGFSGGNTYSSSNSIANTNDPALYQTERWGSFSYNFAAPAGTYAVTLKFAEIYFTSAGRRVFGVSINGVSVLSNFDIAAQAGGADIALDKTFQVNSTGNIQIQFITGSADNPKVDAIQIVATTASSSAIAPTITTQPISQSVAVGQTATFSVAATGTTPMSYQWRKNGTSISGATSSTYTTPATTTADNSAQFSVVVSDSAGSATSAAAVLTVNAASSVLNASATALSFGNVNLSITASQNLTFTNAGNSNVSISNVSVSGSGFNASGISAGTILAPGQNAILYVTFTPAATGSVTGSVTVTSTAANSPSKVSLSGAGVAAISHSVQLSWTASTSTVVGYNCYSSAVTGGPYVKLNTAPGALTNYTDTTVQSGNTYYYVVTAVDSNNVESAYSSEISATVP